MFWLCLAFIDTPIPFSLSLSSLLRHLWKNNRFLVFFSLFILSLSLFKFLAVISPLTPVVVVTWHSNGQTIQKKTFLISFWLILKQHDFLHLQKKSNLEIVFRVFKKSFLYENWVGKAHKNQTEMYTFKSETAYSVETKKIWYNWTKQNRFFIYIFFKSKSSLNKLTFSKIRHQFEISLVSKVCALDLSTPLMYLIFYQNSRSFYQTVG